ncbi:MAG TPA: M14 family zinc carboxypeptidase [Bacteroidales bacterium]|nr:M14 family zinc carboxypeptidase [Bacteroidales bacterium]HRZ76348.1 M14 family zinc carboxypeptidase [Bacteroidales bacterium]
MFRIFGFPGLLCISALVLPGLVLHAQEHPTPSQARNFAEVTSTGDLVSFLIQLDEASGYVTAERIGTSVQGRSIYGLKLSNGVFGEEARKPRVLIFAQQHGNEQSGKEAILLLASRILSPEYAQLLHQIDLYLIPQLNPDGAMLNLRRNGNEADLNRDHLLLDQPETQALHAVFDAWMFHAALDVHEYYPYGGDWEKGGFRKNSEVTVGTLTNPNISGNVRAFSSQVVVPFMLDFIRKKGYSCMEYLPGGPPPAYPMRYSTFDINDGRQSLGIIGTLSLIQEGMNGEDRLTHNLERRAEGQFTGMLAFLEFIAAHPKKIIRIADKERDRIRKGGRGDSLALHYEHYSDGRTLALPVWSYRSGTDSLVNVSNFLSRVRPTLGVKPPLGYLIPASDSLLLNWCERQALQRFPYRPAARHKIKQSFVHSFQTILFEGDTIPDPVIRESIVDPSLIREGDYWFIPYAQWKGRRLALALEPRSMLGLRTYRQFAYLLGIGSAYPILRVDNR